MKVLKFGGSSVANEENIKKVIQIISNISLQHKSLVVVVSAFWGVTDNLIKLASLALDNDSNYKVLLKNIIDQHNTVITKLVHKSQQRLVFIEVEKKYNELSNALRGVSLLKELSLCSLDMIMSFGEQLSAYIISKAINSKKIVCEFVDARLLIKTDENFGSANVDTKKTYKNILNYFKNKQGIFLLGGFISSTDKDVTTTLGRGGSDYTASLLGAGINAEAIEIWTDTDGVLTADPRKVSCTFSLDKISYLEASELSHFGAKVIYTRTIKPTQEKNIPVVIKNTFNPQAKGTVICNDKIERRFPITGVTSLNCVSLLSVNCSQDKYIGKIIARVLNILSEQAIEILMITYATHKQAFCVVLDSRFAQKAKDAIKIDFSLELKNKQMLPIVIKRDLSMVTIVGEQIKGIADISGKIFGPLSKKKINVVAFSKGSSELSISVVIDSKDEVRALQVIHKSFFILDNKSINMFLVGTGVIGSTLLKQIEESKSTIHVCGLANSKKMQLDCKGLVWQNWKEEIVKGESVKIENFVKQMINFNLPNSVFVDCTSSNEIVFQYDKIISAGISIVTPNKKANSGLFSEYIRLKKLAKSNNTSFIYETNVGAGLPIIHTIQNLILSGDEIVRIEAVLSGTLSYIFNSFSASNKKFSEIVREAKANGYTEPDPRDDLNGKDVARKILILSREIGLELEFDEIRISPILSKKCFEVDLLDDFFVELQALDIFFEKKKALAKANDKKLCYIATLHKGKAKISLQEIDSEHPFFNLSGADNIISIITKRYPNTPLVIKGHGAGAEVTAGGVLANILSIN